MARLLFLFLWVLSAAPALAQGVIPSNQAITARSFTNTIGVDTKLENSSGPSASVTTTLGALAYLNPNGIGTGLSTIREGYNAPSGSLNTVGSAGYKLALFGSYASPGSNSGSALLTGINSYVTNGYVSEIEGPLEVDNAGFGLAVTSGAFYTALNATTYSGWPAAVKYQQDVWNTYHATIPIALFSLAVPTNGASNSPAVSAASGLGLTIPGITNRGNVHFYQHFGDAPINQMPGVIAQETGYTPGIPFTISETGFNDDTSTGSGSANSQSYYGNPVVNGKYTLNTLFDAYTQGSRLTVLYELFDEGTTAQPVNPVFEGHWGLFDFSANAKPSATYLHNLLTVISDTSSNAATFTAGSAAYSISGLGSNGNSLLLQEGSGIFDLVIWADANIFVNGTPSTAATQNVTVTFASAENVQVYDPVIGTSPTQTVASTTSVTIAVTDHPLVIAFQAPSSQGKVPVPAPLTGTVTPNAWISYDQSFPGITLACGMPFHFNVAVPPQYNGVAYKYPLYIWLHPDYDADGWYLKTNTNPLKLTGNEGGSYNTSQWQTQYPAFYVLPYADQTNGNGTLNSCNADGSDALKNWGGWFNQGPVGSGTVYSGDTGPNTFALLQLVTFMENQYSIDPGRIYVNGFSLGAIGSEYLCQHYNAYNGSPPVFAACLVSGGGVDEADTPVNSVTGSIMSRVPVWYFGGASDSASPPADYNNPLCTLLGGNPSTQTAITSATADRCGTSQMRYSLCPTCGHQETDANGANVWTNVLMNNFAFAQGAVNPVQRTADFLNMISVQGGISGGGTPYINAAQQVADMQYLGITHYRDGLNINMTGGNPGLIALQALVNAGISMIATAPYPPNTQAPSTQVSQIQAWQALGTNTVFAVEGINEPGLFYPTANYGSSGFSSNTVCSGASGGNGGGGCTWLPVAQYMRDFYTAVKAAPSLANLPFFSASRVGEEPVNVGMQWNVIPTPTPSGVLMTGGTVFGDYINNHVYPTDQQFNHAGVAGACQPNDPTAGNSFNIQTHWDNVTTFVGNFTGYATDALAQAVPRTVTEFGYPTANPGPSANGDRVTEDKKGRCILNGLLTAWQLGLKTVSIYNLYDLSGDGFGLMQGSGGVANSSGTYLHNLTTVLADNSATAKTFTPVPANFSFTGLCAVCQTQVFQKSNGHYEILVWSNATNWNMAAGTPITVASTTVTVNLPAQGVATVFDPTVGTAAVTTRTGVSSIAIAVTDYPQVVDWVAGSGTPSPNNTVVLLGSSQVITDSNLNTWGINSGGQETLNQVVLTQTANVVETAYVSGVVWQENNAGQWYSFTSTGATALGPTTSPLPQSNFSISGGQIHTPSGAVFNGRGFAIWENDITDGAIGNALGQPLTTLFPKVNVIRVSMHLNSGCGSPYNFNQDLPVSPFTDVVTRLTNLGIVVTIANQAYPSTCSVQTGSQLTAEVGWYKAWATWALGNPFVWFETANEPSVNGASGSQALVTAEQVATYNGIRSVGNNSIVVMDLVGGGLPGSIGINCSNGDCLGPASAYQAMKNVVWSYHQYSWTQGGQTTVVPVSSIAANITANVALAQQFTSQDGTMPVIIGEYGPSTDGTTLDASGTNNVKAVQQSGLTTEAYVFNAQGSPDNLTNGSNSGLSSPFGVAVADYIAAGNGPGGGTVQPTLTAPSTLAAGVGVVTSVGSVSATDPPNPSDTMTLVVTSSGSGKLSATGATGNGTNSVTFSGSLTGVNSLLGSLTFVDAVTENPTITYSMQDTHSLSASATTAVTVTGGISPNCTVVTTVGPTITSLGPPAATWSLNSAAQVVVNGTIDTTTKNVVELAYVNGLVWQANSSNLWWSKTQPGDTWNGPTSTNPAATCSTTSNLTITEPATLTAVAGATTPVPGVSVADQAFPLDTMTLTLTSTTGTTMNATGATGNGTAALSFTGTLSGLNSLLSTLSIVSTNGASATVIAGSGGTLTDTGGNRWTITGGVVFENAATAGFSQNVTAIYLVSGTVWQVNASSQWFFWTGTAWSGLSTNPLVSSATLNYVVTDQHSGRATGMTTVTITTSVASPNYTTTRSVGVGITDALGEVFAINSGGQVTVNGTPDGTTSSVVQIAWVNGNMWYLTSGGNWFFKANAAATWGGPTKKSPLNHVTPPRRR